jgi:acyl-CoA synthetase (AMP-forming)/AMP-acid ligase II
LNDVIDLWKLVSIFRDIGVKRENGTVSIVGRKKDMIVRGGENIYPTEVEQFLFRHPMIEDVQVKLICR